MRKLGEGSRVGVGTGYFTNTGVHDQWMSQPILSEPAFSHQANTMNILCPHPAHRFYVLQGFQGGGRSSKDSSKRHFSRLIV